MDSSSAKISFLLFLLTLLSSHQILARESQFFNKIPRKNDVVTEFEPVKQEQVYPLNNKPDQQEPNFLPEYENNNNGYGLYGHESGQLPPSTTTTSTATAAAINVGEPFKTTNHEYSSFPTSKYLPKNYNTEAYVTEAQGYTPTTTTTIVPENNNNNNDNPFSIPNSEYLPNNYNGENGNFINYQQQQEQQERYSTRATGNNYGAGFVQKGYTTNPENNNNNNYYNGQTGNFKNNQQQEQEERYSASEATEYNNYGAGLSQKGYTTTGGGGSNNNNNNYYNNNNNYYNGGNSNYQKQGMSDTRFLENGKYFYDSNLDKSNFVNVNLYENARGFGNSVVNSYDQYNNNAAMEGYQNYQFQDFHDEEDMP